jgi:prepilin-type N-terminal cleavage/methylation domain-containing protein
MPGRNRSAFTLVELLVVIVIIGILMGLLLPAVIGARERARQTQCSNNQREVALAVQGYESDKDHLPGYINNFGADADTSRLSWLVVVLPYLGREDLWTVWRDPGIPLSNQTAGNGKYQTAVGEMPQLICPSDSRSGAGVLSYVANCGIGASTSEIQAHGVFQNRSGGTSPPFTTDRIPDGASNTLLFSENIQATLWVPPLVDPDDATPSSNPWTGLDTTVPIDYREAHVGMVWTASATPDRCRRINQCKDAVVRLYDPAVPGTPLNPPTLGSPYSGRPIIVVARPSSYHVGGVVASYADGHQDYMDEDINYAVFRQLMASHDERAGL